MAVLRIGRLAPDPLSAAADFHARVLPQAVVALDGGAAHLVLVFDPADRPHHGWRLTAVQELARRFVPARVNAVAGDDEQAIAAAITYLEAAPGVTGQLLPLDRIGAGEIVSISK